MSRRIRQYPQMLYHDDGRIITVKSRHEHLALSKQDQGWRTNVTPQAGLALKKRQEHPTPSSYIKQINRKIANLDRIYRHRLEQIAVAEIWLAKAVGVKSPDVVRPITL